MEGTELPSSLCPTCLATNWAYLLDPTEWPERQKGENISHHRSLLDVEKAKDQGCSFCTMIFDGFFRTPIAEALAQAGNELFEEFCDTQCRIESIVCHDLHTKYTPPRKPLIGIRYHGASRILEFLITPLVDDPPSLAMRNLRGMTDLDICKGWISECERHHSRCPPIVNRRLPTRVIDVGDPSRGIEPHLMETNGDWGRYATLSYCWGKPDPVKTSIKNIDRHRRSLHTTGIPRLFTDAFEITRILGLQYLWIDSYCIIQDDGSDKAREIANMADIYSYSAFTIAAPQLNNSYAGIPRGVNPVAIDTSCAIPVSWSGKRSAGLVRISRPFSWSIVKAESQRDLPTPLFTRGWVLQERLLSPRILYFGTDRLFFECHSTQCAELVKYPLDPSMHLMNDSHQVAKAEVHFEGRDAGLAQWYNLVWTYSLLDLTIAKDRLPAIGGIATRFSQKFEDRYIEGLWESDIAFGLSFVQTHPRRWEDVSRPEEEDTKKEDFQAGKAPSWSWAACNQEVSTLKNFTRTRCSWKGDLADLNLFNREDCIASLIEVVSFSPAEIQDGASSSAVTSRLTVRGRLFHALGKDGVVRMHQDRAILYPDYAHLKTGFTNLAMLPLVMMGDWRGSNELDRWWTALALLPTDDGPNTFRRVGVFKAKPAEGREGVGEQSKSVIAKWFTKGEPETIVLV